MKILEMVDVSFGYTSKGNKQQIVDHFNLGVNKSEITLLYGRSGLGKTTILNLMGGLLCPQSGKILFHNKDVAAFGIKELESYRSKDIGYIFQMFYLIPQLTAIDNVIIGMKSINDTYKGKRKYAMELLKSLEMQDFSNRYPEDLSGGQQQRIAIARAIANQSELILADEPTGNLDRQSANDVYRILQELRDSGKAIVMVSHDEYAKNIADNIIDLNRMNET